MLKNTHVLGGATVVGNLEIIVGHLLYFNFVVLLL